MFICAGSIESFSFAKSIGVGLINSAISLSNICMREIPKRLIFIGSAGSYDENIEIGSIFCSTTAYNIELSMIDGNSYTPLDNAIRIEGVNIDNLVDFANVNSSNYITNTDKYNAMFIESGILLENMEFFSVLNVARFYNIPALGIFCVSNHVCHDSHTQFIKNHSLVKEKLISFVNQNFFKNQTLNNPII